MSSFDEVVSEAVQEELSGSEVMELFDKKLGFLLYERLYNFNSLPEVLEGKDATIILYQYTKFEGHYIILLKHDDKSINSKKKDSAENLNKNSIDKEDNSNENRNLCSNNTILDKKRDSNKSIDYGNGNGNNNNNNNLWHERNLDSFICNNINDNCNNNNFGRNDIQNIMSAENFGNSDNNLKNHILPSSYEPINLDDLKKNQIQQLNIYKKQFSSNDSNTVIQTNIQDKSLVNSVSGQKPHDIINPINSPIKKNKKNVNENTTVSKKNPNTDLDSQKLLEIKKNVYNTSNNINNQEHALTQKVLINTSHNLFKDKKFNLNENIQNNSNMKLTFNTNSNNQLNLHKKESENIPALTSKNNQIPPNTKNILNLPINNPIINYINNSSNVNIHNYVKKDNQSNAFTNFDKKRYNLKKFQTSTDSKLIFFINRFPLKLIN